MMNAQRHVVATVDNIPDRKKDRLRRQFSGYEFGDWKEKPNQKTTKK